MSPAACGSRSPQGDALPDAWLVHTAQALHRVMGLAGATPDAGAPEKRDAEESGGCCGCPYPGLANCVCGGEA